MPENRLEQKYSDFKKSFMKLKENTQIEEIDEIVQNSTILMFEITFEQWWKFLQSYIEKRETIEQYGPASTIRQAFEFNLLENGEEWMDMLKSRNLIAHTYNESTAKKIYTDIKTKYIYLFEDFIKKFDGLI